MLVELDGWYVDIRAGPTKKKNFQLEKIDVKDDVQEERDGDAVESSVVEYSTFSR